MKITQLVSSLVKEITLLMLCGSPRAWISLMHADVKERCNAVTVAVIMAIESPTKTADGLRQ